MPFLPSEDLPWPDDAIEVGRIVGAWGIKGGFRVAPFAAVPEALFSSRRWFLKPGETAKPVARPGAAAAAMPAAASTAVKPTKPAKPGAKPAEAPKPVALPPVLKITMSRDQGDSVVATAAEVPGRDEAEWLKGARVFVSRAQFPATDENEFYWVDLIGLDVSDREARVLGRVVGLIETGPHCVLRIHAPGAVDVAPGDEILIPFVDAYVDRVDLPGRVIHVDWSNEF